MENISLFDSIIGLATSILKKFVFIHDFEIKNDYIRIELGVDWGFVFKFVVGIEINADVTSIGFNINDRKYRLRFYNNKIINAIKCACLFLKSIITRNQDNLKYLATIAISKKEYKKAINIKKKAIKKAKQKAHEFKKSKYDFRGPLVINFGN